MMWQEFLTQQGAKIIDDDVQGLGPAWESQSWQSGYVAPLCELGLVRVEGADAASFLHNQLSNDVEHLADGQARRAAYCTPKGRMLASLLYWKADECIYLQLSRSIQAPIQKRLQMFVLRAKAKLADMNAEYVTLGLGGAAAGAVLQSWFAELPGAAYRMTHNQYGSLLRLPDAYGAPRFQWIAMPATAIEVWPALTARLQAMNSSAWRLSEIQAGIPQIVAATQEQFVPQMINFELIGGVNFKKGCYPGQEIVARSQYLGKLKRRMAIASIASTEVRPGMEVYAAADPAQPCGMIVNAERASAAGSLALLEIKVSDLEAGEIRLGAADGVALGFLPLPYEVIDVTQ